MDKTHQIQNIFTPQQSPTTLLVYQGPATIVTGHHNGSPYISTERNTLEVHPPIFFLPAKHTRDTEKQHLACDVMGQGCTNGIHLIGTRITVSCICFICLSSSSSSSYFRFSSKTPHNVPWAINPFFLSSGWTTPGQVLRRRSPLCGSASDKRRSMAVGKDGS